MIASADPHVTDAAFEDFLSQPEVPLLSFGQHQVRTVRVETPFDQTAPQLRFPSIDS